MSPQTFWTAVALVARTGGQVLLTAAAVVMLNPKDGGLWFVFTSLGGVVQFLDLGLTTMVLRAASQFHAGALGLQPKGLVASVAENPNTEALKNLYATMGRVYGVLALGVLLLAAVAGVTALRELLDTPQKVWAYAAFALGAACQLMISCKSNLLQGVGELVKAQKITSTGLVLALGGAAGALVAGAGLLGACAVGAVGWAVAYAIFGGALKNYRGGNFDGALVAVLLPNSVRSGISRVAFACFYYLPVLMIAPIKGVEVAGSYGFTVQICLLLTAVAQLPIASWLPQLNALAAVGKKEELAAEFIRRVRATMGLYGLGGVVLWVAGAPLLALIHAKTTLMPQAMLAVLLVQFFVEAHRNNHGYVATAFNHIPFWKGDLVSAGVLGVGGVWILNVAPMEMYGAWMFGVMMACNAWWAVAEGLRQMKLSWGEYGKKLLGV